MTSTFKWRSDFGDLEWNEATGQFALISGAPKLLQDIRQNIDTQVQPDGTGAALDDLIGFVGTRYEIQREITSRISDSFASFKQLQRQIQWSDRTRDELFGEVTRVEVADLNDGTNALPDQTLYTVKVTVVAENRKSTVTWTGALTR